MILPRRLTHKSRIKIVFPASALRVGRGLVKSYNQGVALLEQHFAVEGSRLLETEDDGFSGSDEARANEINSAFRSTKVDAIIAGRGGYGCLRILNGIDCEQVANSPKALIGFSDITILQAAFYQKAGLVSFSGPMALTIDSDGIRSLLPLLTQDTTGLDLIPAKAKSRIETLSPGIAEGTLLGGNLFSLVQLVGTGFLPRLNDAILFFEDINETVDHIDSYLQHLKLAGLLYGVQGVAIGDLDWRDSRPFVSAKKSHEQVKRRLKTFFRKEIPVMFGLPYGHCDKSITIPFGARARLNTEERSLTLLQEVTTG